MDWINIAATAGSSFWLSQAYACSKREEAY